MRIATHDKTEKIYLVLEEVIDCTNGREDGRMILYQDLKGNKYVRTVKEFYMKFTPRDTSDIFYVDRKNVLDKTE